MYDYDWTNYGALILYFPNGKDVCLQGDKASDLYDELEGAESQEHQDLLIQQYEHLVEEEN